MLVDPNGEEVVLETIYKKDANGIPLFMIL